MVGVVVGKLVGDGMGGFLVLAVKYGGQVVPYKDKDKFHPTHCVQQINIGCHYL